MFRKCMALSMAGLLVWMTSAVGLAQRGRQPSLKELVGRSYLELLEQADQFSFSASQLETFRKQLKREQEREEDRLKEEEKKLEKQIKDLRKELDRLNKKSSRDTEAMKAERKAVHCRVLELEKELHLKETERKQGVPVAFDNRLAKVDVLEFWPAKKREIEQTLASGQARQRRYGDVEDIGIRVLEKGQEKDVKTGQEAIQQMKTYGLIPPEVEDEQINAYVRRLAGDIAAHSDLKVPLNLTVLESEEINAFALPGGYLFVNLGLMEKAETESELAGVIAHEIAHVTARHGARLMKKATIASIIYQAAQVAALILTGGVASIGSYYALQYGFYGLGMVLSLTLLGVSRDYEQEADQLGVQYSWNAGYDPSGFISFFDKMASEKGYVRSASFFRTHPAFFDRIVSSFSEIEYLPAKEDLRVDSTAFREIKERLQVAKEERTEEKKREKRPTLKRLPDCDDEPTG